MAKFVTWLVALIIALNLQGMIDAGVFSLQTALIGIVALVVMAEVFFAVLDILVPNWRQFIELEEED